MSVHSSAIARVQLVVEIDVGAWGPECTLEQATRQAGEDAALKLGRLFLKQTDVHVVRDALGNPIVRITRVDVTFRSEARP